MFENKYKSINDKWERIEPSNIRDDFNNYKKSKKLVNEDISTRTVNIIMAELGYKNIKSRGKWHYENIVKNNVNYIKMNKIKIFIVINLW